MAYEDFTGSLDAPAGGYTEFTGVLDGAPAARREVPDATVGSVARDIAAGVLQIGPTAVKGVTDIARLATGGRVGKDTSEAIERGMAAIRDTVGSERAAAQRENFQRDMADDSVGIGKALMRNKGALADQLLPTVGSMFLPVGVAGVAGKAATATKAAVALEAAELAARVAAVQKAAGIGATAAQNSASTFAELVDKGVPMRDAYVGAGITVPFSVVAGALTGGGAEVAAARALTGAGGAKLGARQLAKAAGQEGAQEMGEELGQVAGEAVATGETPSAVSAGKQLAVAGTLGAVMGGGVDVATQVGQRGQPGTAPTSEKAPASTPVQEAPAQAALQSADTPVSAMEEITRLESVQDAQQSAQQPDGTPQSMDGATASTRLAELEVIDSTTGLNPVQQQERAALAQRVEQEAALAAELEAVGELPQDLATGPAPAERAQAFEPAAVQAKTWPQFVLERGEKIGTLRRGTPAWDQLQQEWAAVKTRRAGTNPEGTGATGAPAQEIQNRDRSRPASVVQMQAMAQNPDYLRLGVSRSPESGAPMVFAVGDQADAVQALGRADVAVMSDGQRVPFRYAVMEAADVQPSNFADGGVNPLFDAAHPGTVKALNNGRTAGLRAAYERGTADGYRQELAADGAMHGIDPAAIDGMQAPVLVRLYSEKDNQVNMGAKSQSQALGLSATEQAATDAALVDSGVLEVFDSGALDSAANRDFARAFIGKLQEQGQDVAGMMDANGALSPAGVTRLQAALVHKAYGDGDLVESLFGSTDNDIRAIGEALKAVAGEWANMRLAAERGAINAQVDVNGNLLQAIRLVQKARRERAALYDAVQQVDMLTGDVPDALTVGMLRLLYSGEYLTRPVGRDRLVEALRDYMGAALATSASGDMFGEQVGPAAILAAISERAGGQSSTQQSNGTSTNTQQTPAPQGGRQPSGGEPAGGRADEAGRGARGPQPDGAGARAAEAGGRGQGQGAQAAQRQQDQQGAEGNGQDRRGEVAPALELASYTAEEVKARQDAQAQAERDRAQAASESQRRAQADAERDSFALTGSDRPADVLEAQGQDPMFSRGPDVDQTQTPEFKRWYGDWQNAGNVHRSQQSSAGLRTDAGGADALPGVQREAGMDSPAGVQPSGPGQVGGDATFTGASGPTGSDGAPLRLYHGTRDDITAFDLNHPNRKDHGWLGAGAYLTSNDFYAEQYAQRKRGEHGPLVMPVYANVRNPYVATQAEKDHIKVGGPRASQAFTEYVKALGHDGVVLDLGEGGIELVAFDPAQVKSAMGNNGDFDPANPDIRFSFAGQQARTADPHALASAQQRIEAGEDAEAVRQDTGWHQGSDGRWRFEIDDSQAQLLFESSNSDAYADVWDEAAQRERGVPLARVLEHPRLFAAYPALGALRVRVDSGMRSAGAFDADTRTLSVKDPYDYKSGPQELLSVLLHEIQHGIQSIEGFATGGNPDMFRDRVNERKMLSDAAILKRMESSQGSADKALALFRRRFEREPTLGAEAVMLSGESLQSIDARKDAINPAHLTPQDQYRHLAGEVEARNTEARQGMSAAERRATSPSQTADVEDANVLITFNGKEMEKAPAPANAIDDFDMTGFLGAMDQGRDVAAQAVQRVRATADAIRAGWANGPEVVVAFDMHDPAIPRAARRADRAQRSGGAAGDPEGIYHNGKVYLLASRLATGQDAARVLFHEALGHHGLSGLYGDALDSILAQIVAARPREVRLKAESYGLDFRRPDHRLQAAEEVLAEMAQARPELGFVRRAVAAVRSWLRQHVPGFAGMHVSDDEIVRDYILPARGWVERGALAAASAPAARLAFSLDSDVGRRALQELAELDDLFTFPKSTQTDLAAIAKEHDPEIAVSKPVSIAGRQEYTLTMSDGKKATLSVRQPSPYGEQVYDMLYTADGMEAVTGRPGVNPEDVPPTPDVWLDVSGLEQGDSGAMAYSIASTFAHNTGSIFIGDPHGLSKTALRRRLEQMISSALKFGTTRHLAPHPDQVRGGHGVPGLRWVYGDDVGNVERMIAASLAAMDNAFPTSSLIEYDADHGTFRRASTGDRLSRQRLADVVGRSLRASRGMDGSGPAKAEAGWRTVARAAVWRALLREQGGQDQGNSRNRGSLLGELAERHSQVLRDPDPENRVFYSRGPDSSASALKESNPGDVPSWEQAQLSALQAKADRFIYEAQDGRIDLKRTQEAIRKSGREIDERFDARLAETLLPGRVAYRTQTFLEREVTPLLRVMARLNVSQTELGDFLHARGAPERNAQIAKVNPGMPDGGAGSNSQGLLLTTAAAQQYIADLPAARRRQLEELATKVDAITKGTRELLVAEGLEKAETIKAWEGAYKHYVPMFRDDIEFGGSGGGGAAAASKRATGSEREAVNILSNILLQRETAIGQAESNRFKVSLYGLALSSPNPNFWATIRPASQAKQIAQDLERMGVDPAVAEAGMQGVPTIRTVDPMTNQVVDRVNPMYKSLPGAMTLKVNGEVRVLMFNEKDERAMRMVAALKGADGLTNFDLASSLVGKTTRWLAAVNTQYNPAFGVVNFVRDTLGGAINLTSTALRGNSLRLLGQVPQAMAGIAEALRGEPDSEWGKAFAQFQADGGQTGFREMFKSSGDRAAKVEKQLALLEREGRLTPANAARVTMKWLDGFNTVMENAVRLSAYKLALDKGMGRPEAARLARELTVDFNRKGRLGRELGPLYAFLNASLQGTERTIRALRGPDGAKIIAGGLALGIAQALLLAMAGFDDDELQEFTKARALIIPMPFEGKKYVAIPLPLGLHVLPNTGRVLTELVIGDHKDAGKKVFDAVGEIAGAVNPLGGGNVFTMDGALRTVAPTIADPFIELGFNRNFAGNQIEKEPVGGDRDARPGYSRVRESTLRSTTGQGYLGISKALNWLSGGSEHEAGVASPTPERVRYIAQTVGGGVLRELEKIINVSTAAGRGEEVRASQVPLFSRFGGRVDEERVAQSRYFDNVRRLERTENTLNAARKAGDGDFMEQLVKERPEVALIQLGNKVQAEVAKLNKLAVSVVDDREALQQIDQARLMRMRALNDTVRELELAQRGPTIAQKIRRDAN